LLVILLAIQASHLLRIVTLCPHDWYAYVYDCLDIDFWVFCKWNSVVFHCTCSLKLPQFAYEFPDKFWIFNYLLYTMLKPNSSSWVLSPFQIDGQLSNFYLISVLKNVSEGQPQDLGTDFSRWMLLERVRFTLDGLECNKIGVGYEAYSSQPDFCTSPLWSCLHNQLWDFWEVSQTSYFLIEESSSQTMRRSLRQYSLSYWQVAPNNLLYVKIINAKQMLNYSKIMKLLLCLSS
jgi:Male gamete fusion factor